VGKGKKAGTATAMGFSGIFDELRMLFTFRGEAAYQSQGLTDENRRSSSTTVLDVIDCCGR
jgi:hypothetical protein